MSVNPWEVLLKSTQGFIQSVRTQVYQFVGAGHDRENEKQKQHAVFSVDLKLSLSPNDSYVQEPTSLHPISSSSKVLCDDILTYWSMDGVQQHSKSLQGEVAPVWPSPDPAEVGGAFERLIAKPLTKEELGRATWTLLHTLAAQYPDNPTRQQKRDVKELMAILSRLYPCKDCADHFGEILKSTPVQVGSHSEFSQWLCFVHNVVNRSLGKVNFPCQRVDARWGKLECKDRGCDLEGEQSKF